MRIGRWFGGNTAVGQLLTAAVLVAQAGMVLAPLVDARDACNPGPLVVIGMLHPDLPQLSTDHGAAPAHNPANCPACIVQSLHARVEGANPLPAVVASYRAALSVIAPARPQTPRPSHRYSRAPPTLS